MRGFPKYRGTVLFGDVFVTPGGSMEHPHPLAIPGDLCIGSGLIPHHLGVPYIISAPAPCWTCPTGRSQQG